jgi:hypothetical protein
MDDRPVTEPLDRDRRRRWLTGDAGENAGRDDAEQY